MIELYVVRIDGIAALGETSSCVWHDVMAR